MVCILIYILIYILRSNKIFYCAMTIYISFILFKSNRVSFCFVNLQAVFVNLGSNIQMRPTLYCVTFAVFNLKV